ncbi:phage regulatory protein/antirepressor Ant [Neorhizobium sp. P12A]|uniref:phage regulatory protein/antirepressor Ant n=1 Tax=Neorhizobium sp. P12A TaxID=2268027 RepID=UPI0011ECEDE3|nr:phage regulatory protein/antirepressor Ant [Neorhizobium sp. P12A]KAA0686002.1 phage regulatory protein/antirepressor Ant [Neorhizobium sp. P12A]
MNELINTTVGQPATMSSIEIADLCGKRHDHVMRDIRVMLEALDEGLPKFGGTYSDSQGKQQKCFHLPRDLTMTLITGYSIPLRKKVIDRLDELERRQPVTIDLNDPANLRALLLDNVNKVIDLQHQLEEMQPAVAALEQIAEAHGSFNRTEAAKHLGIPPHTLMRWMTTNGWTYRRPGSKEDIAYQSKIVAGYLEHKVNTGPRPDGTEWVSTQVRVTPKGLTVLAKAFPRSASAA